MKLSQVHEARYAGEPDKPVFLTVNVGETRGQHDWVSYAEIGFSSENFSSFNDEFIRELKEYGRETTLVTGLTMIKGSVDDIYDQDDPGQDNREFEDGSRKELAEAIKKFKGTVGTKGKFVMLSMDEWNTTLVYFPPSRVK